jgi:hypothetical protein
MSRFTRRRTAIVNTEDNFVVERDEIPTEPPPSAPQRFEAILAENGWKPGKLSELIRNVDQELLKQAIKTLDSGEVARAADLSNEGGGSGVWIRDQVLAVPVYKGQAQNAFIASDKKISSFANGHTTTYPAALLFDAFFEVRSRDPKNQVKAHNQGLLARALFELPPITPNDWGGKPLDPKKEDTPPPDDGKRYRQRFERVALSPAAIGLVVGVVSLIGLVVGVVSLIGLVVGVVSLVNESTKPELGRGAANGLQSTGSDTTVVQTSVAATVELHPQRESANDTIPDEFDKAAPKRYNWAIGTDFVALNASEGNPLEGDETRFLRLAAGQKTKSDPQTGKWSKQELTYRVFVVNDAAGILNDASFDGVGVAKGTRLTLKIKAPKRGLDGYEMFARITADNADPTSVYDRIGLAGETNSVVPSFVPGSAYLLTEKGKQLRLADEVFSTGVLVGDNKLDGLAIAGVKRNFQVFFRVQFLEVDTFLSIVHTLTTLDGNLSGPPGAVWRHKLVVTALGNAPTHDLGLFFYSTNPVELIPGSVTLEGNQVATNPFAIRLPIGTLESGKSTLIEFQTRSQGCDPTAFSFAPSYRSGTTGTATKDQVVGATTAPDCSSTTSPSSSAVLSGPPPTCPGASAPQILSPETQGRTYFFEFKVRRSADQDCFEDEINDVVGGSLVRVKLRYVNTSQTVQKNVLTGLLLAPGLDFTGPFQLVRSGGGSTSVVQVSDLIDTISGSHKNFNAGDYPPNQGFELTGELTTESRCGTANYRPRGFVSPQGQEAQQPTVGITIVKDCFPN